MALRRPTPRKRTPPHKDIDPVRAATIVGQSLPHGQWVGVSKLKPHYSLLPPQDNDPTWIHKARCWHGRWARTVIRTGEKDARVIDYQARLNPCRWVGCGQDFGSLNQAGQSQ